LERLELSPLDPQSNTLPIKLQKIFKTRIVIKFQAILLSRTGFEPILSEHESDELPITQSHNNISLQITLNFVYQPKFFQIYPHIPKIIHFHSYYGKKSQGTFLHYTNNK
jgi:hypothetical protein